MKYIIVESIITGPINLKHPILFPDHLVHADMVPKAFVAVSAGDISLQGNEATCSGKSITLKLSAKEKDSVLISQWLTFGEAIMVMASCDYDETP
jgi:hypothetical protein